MDVTQLQAVIQARYESDAEITKTATRLLFGAPDGDEFSRRPWVAVDLDGFEDVSTFGPDGEAHDYEAPVRHRSNDGASGDNAAEMSRLFRNLFHERKLVGPGVAQLIALHVGTEGPKLVDGAYEVTDLYTFAVDWE